MNIFFSICIFTYNRANLVSETINSLLSQNYDDYEIIIVDDGSIDNTDQIVLGFNSAKIRYVKKEHTGIPDSRNRCIKESRGDYLVWIGSDDLFTPDLLETYNKFLLCNPYTDVVGCNIISFDDSSKTIIKKRKAINWKNNNQGMLKYFFYSTPLYDPGCAVNKRVYKELGGYNVNYLRANDFEFWSRVALSGKYRIEAVNSYMCYRRIHNGNISGKMDRIVCDFSYEVNVLNEILKKKSITEIFNILENDEQSLAKAYSDVISRFKNLNNLVQSIRYGSLFLLQYAENTIVETLHKSNLTFMQDLKLHLSIATKVSHKIGETKQVKNYIKYIKNNLSEYQAEDKLSDINDSKISSLLIDQIHKYSVKKEYHISINLITLLQMIMPKSQDIDLLLAFQLIELGDYQAAKLVLDEIPKCTESVNLKNVIDVLEANQEKLDMMIFRWKDNINSDKNPKNTKNSILKSHDFFNHITNKALELNKNAIDLFQRAQKCLYDSNYSEASALIKQYRNNIRYDTFFIKDGRVLEMPKLSIIIVAYNTRDDLIKCINSIYGQLNNSAEIIVVDNGKNDEVVSDILMMNLLYIKCPYNFILSEGRNIGVHYAKGDIIAFLDDDAIAESHYVNSVIKSYQQHSWLAMRGKVLPKSVSKNNIKATHYDHGDQPFVYIINTEGNSAVLREYYIELGGQDPLLFGGEGHDLTIMISSKWSKDRIIYDPTVIIYHDYAVTDVKNVTKSNRHKVMNGYLIYKYGFKYQDFLKWKNKIEFTTAGREYAINLLKSNDDKIQQNRIDFVVWERHHYNHLLPIWERIPNDVKGFFYVIAEYDCIEDFNICGDTTRFKIYNGVVDKKLYSAELNKSDSPIVVSSMYLISKLLGSVKRPIISTAHGAAQTYLGIHHYLNDRSNIYLDILPGNQSREVYERRYPLTKKCVVGSPILDRWHKNFVKPDNKKPVIALSFHFDRKTIPETRSAFEFYRRIIPELAKQSEWTILGHGHPRILDEIEPIYQECGIEIVKKFDDVMARADLYICDNSSTLYEFASTDRPVVVLNAPWYRKEIEHGLRFWKCAEVGVLCNNPDDLVNCIKEALIDTLDRKNKRQEIVKSVYAYTDGKASERAASAIYEISKKLIVKYDFLYIPDEDKENIHSFLNNDQLDKKIIRARIEVYDKLLKDCLNRTTIESKYGIYAQDVNFYYSILMLLFAYNKDYSRVYFHLNQYMKISNNTLTVFMQHVINYINVKMDMDKKSSTVTIPMNNYTQAQHPSRRVVFVAVRELHLPVLIPIYKQLVKLREDLGQEYEIGFMSPPYKKSTEGSLQEGLSEVVIGSLLNDDIPFWGWNETGEKFACVIFPDLCYWYIDGWGPVVNVGHGTISKGIYFTDAPIARRENFAETLCVPGQWYKECYRDQVFINVVETGFAKMDELCEKNINELKNSLFGRIGFCDTKKTILFAPTFNIELTSLVALFDIWPKIDRMYYQVIIKLHGVTDESLKEVYRKLATMLPGFYYAEDNNIANYMLVSDLLVSDVSSVFLEYLALGKPVILYNNPDMFKYPKYNQDNVEFLFRDAAYQIDRPDELVPVLRQIEQSDILTEKRLQYAEKLFMPQDGNNSLRIATEIWKVATSKKRVEPAVLPKLSILISDIVTDVEVINENIRRCRFDVQIYKMNNNSVIENTILLGFGELPPLPLIVMEGSLLLPFDWDLVYLMAERYEKDGALFGPVLSKLLQPVYQQDQRQDYNHLSDDHKQMLYKYLDNSLDSCRAVSSLNSDCLFFSSRCNEQAVRLILRKQESASEYNRLFYQLRREGLKSYAIPALYAYHAGIEKAGVKLIPQTAADIFYFDPVNGEKLSSSQIEVMIKDCSIADLLKNGSVIDVLKVYHAHLLKYLQEYENNTEVTGDSLRQKKRDLELLFIILALLAEKSGNIQIARDFCTDAYKICGGTSLMSPLFRRLLLTPIVEKKYLNALPLVSVVIPLYNQGVFLEDALKSVINQSYTNWEIVIVNDGSTDDSYNIAKVLVEKYRGYKISLLDQRNQGKGRTRNRGVAEAQGKYICLLDADDMIASTYLYHAVERLELALPHIGYIVPKTLQFGRVDQIYYSWENNSFLRTMIVCPAPVTAIFRKDMWTAVNGYTENMTDREDWEFWMKAAELGYQAIFTKGVEFIYRLSNQQWGHKPEINIKSKYEIYKMYKHWYGDFTDDQLKKMFMVHNSGCFPEEILSRKAIEFAKQNQHLYGSAFAQKVQEFKDKKN